MQITVRIIRQMLSKRHTIMPDMTGANPSLCGFRFFDGSPATPGHIYIISPDELAFLPQDYQADAYLCNGASIDPEDLKLPGHPAVLCLSEPADSRELCNELNAIFEKMECWEEMITHLKPDVSDIKMALNSSRDILNGTIILVDNRFHYIAFTDDFRGSAALLHPTDDIPQYVMEDILTDPAYQSVQSSREVVLYQVHTARKIAPALCYNLFKKGSAAYNARIMLISRGDFTPDQYDLLKILGDSVSGTLWQIAHFSFPAPAFSSLHHVVSALLNEEPSSRALIRSILHSVGWNSEDRYVLILFSPYFIREKDEINAVSVNQLELLIPDSCGVVIDQQVALIINLGQPDRTISHFHFQENIAAFLRDSLYKAGISNEFDDFFRIRFALYEAKTALQIGNIRDNMYWYYRFSDYAMAFIISNASEKVFYKDLVSQAFMDLLTYDRNHSTSLANTLEHYVKNKFNVTHTAADLYLNRSTVLAHLKKIQEITSMDLDDWHIHLHLLISFALLENE